METEGKRLAGKMQKDGYPSEEKPISDRELETTIIGSMLLENPDEVIILLDEDDFFYMENKTIFQCAKSMFSAGMPIDILTVTRYARSKGLLEQCGGAKYITRTTYDINSVANVTLYMAFLKELTMKRELLKIGQEIIKTQGEVDIFEVFSKVETIFEDAIIKFKAAKIANIAEIMHKTVDQAQKTKESGVEINGVPSGFKKLDAATCGWQKGELIIIAGRPGHLKSVLGLQFAAHSASICKPCLFISMEMLEEQLGQRYISSETGIDGIRIKKGRFSDHEAQMMKDLVKKSVLDNTPLYIHSVSDINPSQLRALVKQAIKQYQIELVVIDYLQLMSDKTERSTREQEVSKISRGCKKIAMDFKIPVIALAQLSRQVDSAKRIQLSDIRESGSLEQDASVVLFTMRPELWNESSYVVNDTIGEVPTKDLVVLDLAKNRQGGLGAEAYRFIPNLTKVVEYDHYAPAYDVNKNMPSGAHHFSEPRKKDDEPF